MDQIYDAGDQEPGTRYVPNVTLVGTGATLMESLDGDTSDIVKIRFWSDGRVTWVKQ